MKLLTTYLLAAITLLAQTTGPAGSVTATQPIPVTVKAVAGSVTCTFTGNAIPATAVVIACTLGTSPPFTYTLPMANSTYYVEHAFCSGCAAGVKGDDVNGLFSASASGIKWQVAATPNGGTAATLSGSF